MSWWDQASVEQRLAQIDGGIECGLSARFVAIASGCSDAKSRYISAFARDHGRHFPFGRAASHGGQMRRSELAELKRAYKFGEAVDFAAPVAVGGRIVDTDFDEAPL